MDLKNVRESKNFIDKTLESLIQAQSLYMAGLQHPNENVKMEDVYKNLNHSDTMRFQKTLKQILDNYLVEKNSPLPYDITYGHRGDM